MKVKKLNLLLTYRCPSQCRHCGYFCGLEGRGLMTAQDVKGYLQELSDHPLESLWIYGGEPFLYSGVLMEMVKIARKRHVPRIGVLTNGYWATSSKGTLKKLSDLKSAGLNAIVISSDGFHTERVPPEFAINAAQAAVKLRLEEVAISVAFLSPRGGCNSFNDRSEEIWAQFKGIPGISLREDSVTVIGRAAERLLGFCRLRQIQAPDTCQPPSYIGGSFDQPEGLEIDPHGWAMICPGFSLGNAKEKSLAVMLDQYENSENTLWHLIRQQGPAGLLDLACQKGYVQRDLYASACHLCYEVRKFLSPHYPDNLAPTSCYMELSRKG